MKSTSVWLREPLVLFFAIGVLVVAVHAATREAGRSERDQQIVVTDADVNWLRNGWQKRWQRPPTDEELRGLLANHLREEILYREAVKLGLDRDDQVIRRRLVTKLEFLAKDLGAIVEPTEAEVSGFFAENRDRYEIDAQRSFTQVYFNEDERGARAEVDARTLLTALREEKVSTWRAAEIGDSFLLQSTYPLSSHREIGQLFGTNFSDTLFTLPVGEWQGPIRSGYGLHLVCISEETAAWVPPLAEVRVRVRDDLVTERRRQSLEVYYNTIRQKYQIEITASGFQAEEESKP